MSSMAKQFNNNNRNMNPDFTNKPVELVIITL